MSAPKVLVLSVGSGVGYGVVAALRMASRPFTVIGVNSVARAAGLFECDTAYLAPPTDDAARFGERLVEIVRAERPAMIVPGRDADLAPLAALKPLVEPLGAFVLTGSPEAVAICSDKISQANALGAAGVPFAKTAADVETALALAADVGFPLIAKPRAGHGSVEVRLVHDVRELRLAFARPVPTIVQQYLEPDEWRQDGGSATRRLEADGSVRQDDEYSVQVLIGRDARLLGSFASRNRLERGVPMVVEVVDHAGLDAMAATAARSLGERGLIGPCNLQARRVGGRFVAFELNARFTGLTPVRARMGHNEVEAAFRYFVEGDLPASFLAFDKRQVAVRHLTESVFTAEALGELARSGRWRRSS